MLSTYILIQGNPYYLNMASCLIMSFIYIIKSCDIMFTVSGMLIGGHFDRFLFTIWIFCHISTVLSWRIIIHLDKGSISMKGQGKKLSDMGPPYFCNNSKFWWDHHSQWLQYLVAPSKIGFNCLKWGENE